MRVAGAVVARRKYLLSVRAQFDTLERAALIVALIIAGTMIVRSVSESHWKRFSSSEGAFSVLMPGKPKAESESTEVNGIKVETHSFSASNRTNAHFSVAFSDAPTTLAIAAGERILDARRSLTQGDESRLLSAESLTVNGFPVRRYKAIAGDGSQADERLYLVRRQLYILLVVHDPDRDDDDVKRFFDSFTFEPRQ